MLIYGQIENNSELLDPKQKTHKRKIDSPHAVL